MWTALAYAAMVIVCDLPYAVFDGWWHTRFLLPALLVTLALAAAVWIKLVLSTPARGAIAVVSTAALASG